MWLDKGGGRRQMGHKVTTDSRVFEVGVGGKETRRESHTNVAYLRIAKEHGWEMFREGLEHRLQGQEGGPDDSPWLQLGRGSGCCLNQRANRLGRGRFSSEKRFKAESTHISVFMFLDSRIPLASIIPPPSTLPR